MNVGSLLGTISDSSNKDISKSKEIKKYNPPKKEINEEFKIFDEDQKNVNKNQEAEN